jgi:S-formylglutathione hydrolase FrmB
MNFKKYIFLFLLVVSINAFAGSVDTLLLNSVQLNKQTKVVIVKPNSANNNDEKYPVIYLLHGYGGNYAQWSKIAPQLSKAADDLKIIFVCPDGGKGSWYFDSPIDSSIKYESYITKELIPFIDANFSTKPESKFRAITGLSMGGHGALYLAIRHPNLFGAAGSTSGGVDFRPFPNNWDIKLALGNYEENKDRWEQSTVLHQVENLQNNKLAIMIDCGIDDFFITVNRALHEKLLLQKINHDYIERPGVHNANYWNNSIDFQILFFKKFFN